MLQFEYVNKSKGDKNPEDFLEKISCDMGDDTTHILEIDPRQKSSSILIIDKLNPNTSSYNTNHKIQDLKRNQVLNAQKFNNSEISFHKKIYQNLNNLDNSMKINFPNNFLTNKNKNKIKLTYENQNINFLKFSQDSFDKLTIKEKDLTEKEFLENNQKNKNDGLAKKYTFPFKENSDKNIIKEEQSDGHLNFAKIFNHKMSMNYFTIHENEKKNFNMNTIHVFPKIIEKNSETEINSKNLKIVRNKSIGKSTDLMYNLQIDTITSKNENIQPKQSTRNIHGTNSSASNLATPGTQAANQKFYKANYIKKSTSMTFVNSFVDEAMKLNKNYNFDTLNKINEKLEESYEGDAGKLMKQIHQINDKINIEDNKSEISGKNKSNVNVTTKNSLVKNNSINMNNFNHTNNTVKLKNLENFNTNTIIANNDYNSNLKSPIMSPLKSSVKSFIKSPNKPSMNNQIKSPVMSPLKFPPAKEKFMLKIDHKNAFKTPEIKNENYGTLSKNNMNANNNVFHKPKKVTSNKNVNSKLDNKNITLPTENKNIKIDKNTKNNLIYKEVKVLNDKEMENKSQNDFTKKNSDQPFDRVKSPKTLYANGENLNEKKFDKNAIEKYFAHNKIESKLPQSTSAPIEEKIKKNLTQTDTIERNKEMKMKKILNEFQDKNNVDNYSSFMNSNRVIADKERNEEGNKKKAILINLNKTQVKAKYSGGNVLFAKNFKKS